MENMKMEDVTRRYSVYITDQSRTENLSGVLFYQGGDSMFVFTCAHEIENVDIVRLFFLKPIDEEKDLYQVFMTDVSQGQVRYAILDEGSNGNNNEKIYSEDFAVIQIQKPENFDIEPTDATS